VLRVLILDSCRGPGPGELIEIEQTTYDLSNFQRFAPEDEAIVFASRQENGTYVVMACGWGGWRIRTHALRDFLLLRDIFGPRIGDYTPRAVAKAVWSEVAAISSGERLVPKGLRDQAQTFGGLLAEISRAHKATRVRLFGQGPAVIIYLAVLLLLVTFWGWAIDDCLTLRTLSTTMRYTWLCVILLMSVVGAAAYALLRRARWSGLGLGNYMHGAGEPPAPAAGTPR
jgi:hypothetical protein